MTGDLTYFILSKAFFLHKDGTPVAYYDLSSNWANLYQSTLWNVQILIGDSLLVRFPSHLLANIGSLNCIQVYRMYVVYSRRLWVISIPVLLLVASAGELKG